MYKFIIISISILVILWIVLVFINSSNSQKEKEAQEVEQQREQEQQQQEQQKQNSSNLYGTRSTKFISNNLTEPNLGTISKTLSSKRYLVLKNYNPAAGLFWCVYNILCAAHTARKYNLALVVIFDSGLYLETNTLYQKKYSEYVDPKNNNWFHYYFQSLAEGQPYVQQQIRKHGLLNNMKSFTEWDQYKNNMAIRAFEFDRDAYDSRDMKVNYTKEWYINMKLRPHMVKKIDDFYDTNMRGKFMVGIHVRGTDKYPEKDSSEDGPKHYSYQHYCNLVENAISKHYKRVKHFPYLQQQQQQSPIGILACSDEQPFIDYIHEKLGSKYSVVSAQVIRSQTNTSDLDLNSEQCTTEDQTPNCVRYRQLAGESVHRGMKHLSSYVKGEDVILEVLLLSKCNIFLRSKGNVSNCVTYISPSILTIDMVDQTSQK